MVRVQLQLVLHRRMSDAPRGTDKGGKMINGEDSDMNVYIFLHLHGVPGTLACGIVSRRGDPAGDRL
jgi:hypothetical protein